MRGSPPLQRPASIPRASGSFVRQPCEHTFVKAVRKRYDWPAIRDFYQRGHSAAACQREFGVSNGAWHGAVQRGAIVLRPSRRGTPRTGTRAAIAMLLADGLSQAEIADKLGVSRPTVCFHLRRLGVPANSTSRRRYDWNEIRAFYDSGHSIAECRREFGFGRDTWRAAVRRGAITQRPRLEPLEDVLAAGRPRSRQHVKARLLSAGVKIQQCDTCGLSDWLGAPISLELHHINGDGFDNRLQNLQLLCPNCHSQTDTWGARNRRKRMHR
jgi:5-methylcytosine-specific restriction endonuclease McrA